MYTTAAERFGRFFGMRQNAQTIRGSDIYFFSRSRFYYVRRPHFPPTTQINTPFLTSEAWVAASDCQRKQGTVVLYYSRHKIMASQGTDSYEPNVPATRQTSFFDAGGVCPHACTVCGNGTALAVEPTRTGEMRQDSPDVIIEQFLWPSTNQFKITPRL